MCLVVCRTLLRAPQRLGSGAIDLGINPDQIQEYFNDSLRLSERLTKMSVCFFLHQ